MKKEEDMSGASALTQSGKLIEAMDEEFALKSEVSLSQSILMRNQELIAKIDVINKKEGTIAEEETVKKNSYMLELHSNMAGMSRLLKEMTAAGAAQQKSGDA